MVKKANIDEFKRAFRKPKRVKGVAKKDKEALEKAANDLMEGDYAKRRETFETKAGDLYRDKPAYFTELLTYKLAKHWDEGDEEGFWLSHAPAQAVTDALDNIFGNPLDD